MTKQKFHTIIQSILLLFVISPALFSLSAPMSFKKHTILEQDSIPRLVSPANESILTCIPLHVKLRWTLGVTFDNSYFIEVGRDSSFNPALASEVLVSDTVYSFEIPQPQLDTIYWRVRTSFDTTPTWRFILRKDKATTIIAPKTDTVFTNPVSFSWNSVAGGYKYELLNESTAFTRRDTIADTTARIPLLGLKSYTWKVRVLCGDGFGDWSDEGRFYIGTETSVHDDATDTGWPFHTRIDGQSKVMHVQSKNIDIQLHTCELYNSLGELVLRLDGAGRSECSLNLSPLSSGLFILLVDDGHSIHRRTLILEQ